MPQRGKSVPEIITGAPPLRLCTGMTLHMAISFRVGESQPDKVQEQMLPGEFFAKICNTKGQAIFVIWHPNQVHGCVVRIIC